MLSITDLKKGQRYLFKAPEKEKRILLFNVFRATFDSFTEGKIYLSTIEAIDVGFKHPIYDNCIIYLRFIDKIERIIPLEEIVPEQIKVPVEILRVIDTYL